MTYESYSIVSDYKNLRKKFLLERETLNESFDQKLKSILDDYLKTLEKIKNQPLILSSSEKKLLRKEDNQYSYETYKQYRERMTLLSKTITQRQNDLKNERISELKKKYKEKFLDIHYQKQNSIGKLILKQDKILGKINKKNLNSYDFPKLESVKFKETPQKNLEKKEFLKAKKEFIKTKLQLENQLFKSNKKISKLNFTLSISEQIRVEKEQSIKKLRDIYKNQALKIKQQYEEEIKRLISEKNATKEELSLIKGKIRQEIAKKEQEQNQIPKREQEQNQIPKREQEQNQIPKKLPLDYIKEQTEQHIKKKNLQEISLDNS